MSFAEVDVDDQVQLAKMFQIVNVPTVAYIHSGKPIATLIGANQDVTGRTERVLRGESIGYKDGMSRD